MKLLIGVVGEMRGGKGSFVRGIEEHFRYSQFLHLSTSTLIREFLLRWEIKVTRETMQALPIALAREPLLGGDSAIANAMRSRIEEADQRVVVFDAIRWRPDLDLVRSFTEHLVVNIEAAPEVRWERERRRRLGSGEADISLDEFLASGQVLTEKFVPELAKLADFRLENNSGVHDFNRVVNRFYNDHVAPRL